MDKKLQYFDIVFSIAQFALRQGDAGRVQVGRLLDALNHDGLKEEGSMVAELLESVPEPKSAGGFAQSGIASAVPGEALVKKTAKMPVDRESAAPLAQIINLSELNPQKLILPESLKRVVASLVSEWKHAKELEAVGVEPARTLILFGAPGTGKTQLAFTLAKQFGLPIIVARLDGLISSFLGTTSRNIANLFEFANRHKAILLLDEFDAIAKLRDDDNEVGEIKRVVNTLLQHLDQRRKFGLTIGITNHPQLLDPAIWRRFELQIEMPKPSAEAREQIVKTYLLPLKFSSAENYLLAWYLDGCAGAEVEDFVKSVKKQYVLSGRTSNIIERLKAVSQIHAVRINADRRKALELEEQEFAFTLYAGGDFTQEQLSTLFKVNRGTISRWIKAQKEKIDEGGVIGTGKSSPLRIKSKKIT